MTFICLVEQCTKHLDCTSSSFATYENILPSSKSCLSKARCSEASAEKMLRIEIIFLVFLFFCKSEAQNRPHAPNLRECEPCDVEACRTPAAIECLAGIFCSIFKIVVIIIFFNLSTGYVLDKCGCCQVCGRSEHELCDVSPEDGKFGICGDNLKCISKTEVSFRLLSFKNVKRNFDINFTPFCFCFNDNKTQL